jgi:hypothetical protein
MTAAVLSAAVFGTAFLVDRHFKARREAMNIESEPTPVSADPAGGQPTAVSGNGELLQKYDRFQFAGRDTYLQGAVGAALPSGTPPIASGRRSIYWMPRSEEGLERPRDLYEIGNPSWSTPAQFTNSVNTPWQVYNWKPDTWDVTQITGSNGMEATDHVLPHEGLLQQMLGNMRSNDYTTKTNVVRMTAQEGRSMPTGNFQYAPPPKSGAVNTFETKRKNIFGISQDKGTLFSSALTNPADAGQRYGKDREYAAWNDLPNMGAYMSKQSVACGNDSRRDRSEYRLYYGTRDSDGPTARLLNTTNVPQVGQASAQISRKSDGSFATPRGFFKPEKSGMHASAVMDFPESTVRRTPDGFNSRKEFAQPSYGGMVGGEPNVSSISANRESLVRDRGWLSPSIVDVAPHVSGLAPSAANTMQPGILENSSNF